VGKSTVTREVAKSLAEKMAAFIVWVTNLQSQKRLWQDLCWGLRCDICTQKVFDRNRTIAELKADVVRRIQDMDASVIIVADGLDKTLQEKVVDDLCALVNYPNVVFVVTLRSLSINRRFTARLREKIEISLPEPEEATKFGEYLAGGRAVEDISSFTKTLVRKSGGNPGIMKTIVKQFPEDEVITNRALDAVEYQGARNTRYMYPILSGLLILLLFGNRYISRALTGPTGGRHTYVLGAMGLVLAIVYRFLIYPALKRKGKK
jgi:hypothetical protein